MTPSFTILNPLYVWCFGAKDILKIYKNIFKILNGFIKSQLKT